jgi:uracil-DNA glycosylase
MSQIHESWNPLFSQYEFDLDVLYGSGNIVYPPRDCIFKVFTKDVNEIRVLLLGQDPYHTPGCANGLSFSVNDRVKIPPSLQNIYKELQDEFPERNYKFKTGNIQRWFNEEHIFLLNASLSVIKGTAGSHMHIWEEFTNDVIKFVSEQNKDCVFVLLGNFAKSKQVFIDNKDKIVAGVHPSPFSAHNGFFGSGIFKKIEQILGKPIDWSV